MCKEERGFMWKTSDQARRTWLLGLEEAEVTSILVKWEGSTISLFRYDPCWKEVYVRRTMPQIRPASLIPAVCQSAASLRQSRSRCSGKGRCACLVGYDVKIAGGHRDNTS